MIRLYLYGQMRKDYGEYFDVEAKTPREAVTALAYQCPKYKKYFTENNWHIILGEQENEISKDELDIGLGKYQEVHLIPEIMGEGKWGTAIVGAIITVIGVFVPGAQALTAVGVGMLVGGIISATTKIPGGKETRTEEQDKRASFLFTGAVNTSTQGVPIPRGYGRLLIGSSVISASVYAEELR